MKLETLSEKDWLDIHRDPSIVTASQLPVIAGESTFMSALELWAQKLGKIEPPESSLHMRIGHALEDTMHDEYERRRGVKLHDPGDYTVAWHDDHDWLCATFDRLVDGTGEPVEFKTTSDYKKFTSTYCSDGAKIQAQTQIAIAATDGGGIGALVGFTSFYTYKLRSMPRLFDNLVILAAEFRDMCMSGTQPAPDWSASAERTIKLLHPQDNGETILLPDDAWQWHNELQIVSAEISELEKRKRGLKNKLMDAIGDATYGEINDVRYTFRTTKRKRYTVKASTVRTLGQPKQIKKETQ